MTPDDIRRLAVSVEQFDDATAEALRALADVAETAKAVDMLRVEKVPIEMLLARECALGDALAKLEALKP